MNTTIVADSPFKGKQMDRQNSRQLAAFAVSSLAKRSGAEHSIG